MNFTRTMDFDFWVSLTVGNAKTATIKGHSEDGHFKGDRCKSNTKYLWAVPTKAGRHVFPPCPPQENLISDSSPMIEPGKKIT